MYSKLLLNCALSADAVLLLAALGLMVRAGAHRLMPAFAAFLAVCGIQTAVAVAVMFHRAQLHLSPLTACQLFSYSSWAVQILGTLLIFLSIRSIYLRLMKPLPGLQRMGRILFTWVSAVAACLACYMALGPHLVGAVKYATILGQLQGAVSVLVLCLLLAVCFITRPLGFSYQSRLFGTTLGLGLLSASTLVEAAWVPTLGSKSPYAPVHLIGAFGCTVAATVWSVYFARPEPARRIITLPTTSPFFFWNRVAEVLGDEPGRVAVSGVTPEMFSPAELLAFASPVRQAAPVVEMPHVARR